MGYYIWPNAYVGATYGDEINYLKDWITSRFEWMDENLANAPNSLEEDNLNPGIVVYPNPFQNQINIVLPDTKVASYTLVISDISGKTFWSHDYTLTGHSNLLIVSGSGPSGTELNNGIYILRLYKDHQIFYTTKIVKNG